MAQVGLSREAPAMFKHGDIYLMITSGCTGWQANRAEIFYARCFVMSQSHLTAAVIMPAMYTIATYAILV